jgi:UDP-N-acetylmuramate dehydrogenase
MLVEKNVPLQSLNTFHIVARAQALVRIGSEADALALLADPEWGGSPKFVLGGGEQRGFDR